MRLFFALLLCGMTPVQHTLNASAIVYGTYENSMGKMIVNYPVCSGFVVRSHGLDTTIATARHCVDGMGINKVGFYGGDSAKDIVSVTESAKNDVAIIRMNTLVPHEPLAFSYALERGDPLYIIGMPSGDPYSYTDATSRNGSQLFDGGWYEGKVFLINAPSAWHGDSGAPVSLMDGSVVGVLDAGGDADSPGVVEIAPIQSVFDLLN